jgi:hypothetical protein
MHWRYISNANPSAKRKDIVKFNRATIFSTAIVGSVLFACSADAQSRSRTTTTKTKTTTTTVQSVQDRYGIQGAYDGTRLHPTGRPSTAVPVTMDDGRTGEFVIPSGRDANAVYYRDDQTGDLRPVRMENHTTRQQVVQAPRAVRYRAEPQPRDKQSWGWAQEALIVGGSAGGGALIGAAADGKKGAGVGAAVGGVGGLIFDLLSRNKK